jgi:hypothetical protein
MRVRHDFTQIIGYCTFLAVEMIMSDKTLSITSVEDAVAKVSDIKVVGNGDTFQLLCKASSVSQNWMKSAKAMEIEGVGCVVQVTTQQGSNVAESLVFVPNVTIADDVNGGRKLVTAN